MWGLKFGQRYCWKFSSLGDVFLRRWLHRCRRFEETAILGLDEKGVTIFRNVVSCAPIAQLHDAQELNLRVINLFVGPLVNRFWRKFSSGHTVRGGRHYNAQPPILRSYKFASFVECEDSGVTSCCDVSSDHTASVKQSVTACTSTRRYPSEQLNPPPLAFLLHLFIVWRSVREVLGLIANCLRVLRLPWRCALGFRSSWIWLRVAVVSR